jgi:hypothetical protein
MYTVTNWPNRDPIRELGASLPNHSEFNLDLFLSAKKINEISVFFLNKYSVSLFSIKYNWSNFRNTLRLYACAENNLINNIDYLGLVSCTTCYTVWGACKTAAFLTTQACNKAVTSGCAISCTGSGPAYIACIALCVPAGLAGCGVTGLLLQFTCDAARDSCLEDCCP